MFFYGFLCSRVTKNQFCIYHSLFSIINLLFLILNSYILHHFYIFVSNFAFDIGIGRIRKVKKNIKDLDEGSFYNVIHSCKPLLLGKDVCFSGFSSQFKAKLFPLIPKPIFFYYATHAMFSLFHPYSLVSFLLHSIIKWLS